MSATGPPPVTASSSGRPRQRRGPRRGRGGATSTPQPADPSLAIRPASVTPQSTQTSTSSRGNGRRGGYRGRGRGGGQLLVNGQRTFGGQLTAATPSEGSLAGDAPEFIPGQPVAPRARTHQPRNPPRRRMSKSQAPDIATRVHEDIANGQYECVICTNEHQYHIARRNVRSYLLVAIFANRNATVEAVDPVFKQFKSLVDVVGQLPTQSVIKVLMNHLNALGSAALPLIVDDMNAVNVAVLERKRPMNDKLQNGSIEPLTHQLMERNMNPSTSA
ncbi:Transcriptional repressor NF-X1 [Cadophora gregata f. sp. sojae]|nr:Transcriptional repressor NF-X1 [Cadophora gregata f. sp. sojae]